MDGSHFVFGIPLIGSYLAEDFQATCKLLGQTLTSCLRQTDMDFSVVVACNDVPDPALVPASEKIKYIVTERASRAELEGNPRSDVTKKRKALIRTAVELGARYYFPCDADDLVSMHLVSQVKKIANNNGQLLHSGYLLDSRTSKLYKVPSRQFPSPTFYELCGSSNIVSLDTTAGPLTKASNVLYLERILIPGHNIALKSYESLGRPPEVMLYPGCIYRANHGSNLYLRLNRQDRTNFMDAVAAECAPLAGSELESVKQEFALLKD